MNDPIKIVQAHLEHIDKVVDLYGGYRVFYGQERDREREKSFLEQRIEKQESVILLAMDEDGDAMGFTQLYPLFSSVTMRRVWLLNDLYVDSNFRRRGVAAALLDSAFDYAKNTGARHIMLETAMDNYDAQKLYEKNGWERDDETFMYFKECDTD
jgi:ribosomal protein S18 acetylase RimI-like enzyme